MSRSATISPPLAPARRLAGMRPYAPPPVDARVTLKLDANEGPAPGSRVMDAIAQISPEALRRYPDASSLECRIADRWSIDPSRVVVTNGSDDAIDRVCRSILDEGDVALLHTPTFEMIGRGARLAGATIETVPWLEGPFPVAAMLDAIGDRTRLIALVSPNNPTGGVMSLSDIETIADAAARRGALVLVDLAYAEFADTDPTSALVARPNVVITRTWSKALGLAGARVGCAIATETVAGWLRTAGNPYPVSSVSLAIAGAAMDRPDERSAFVRSIRTERAALTERVISLGATPLPSQANFVTARFANAPFLRGALASLGVGVREFTRPGVLEGLLRITLPGDAESFDHLARAVDAVTAPEALLLDLDGVLADVGASYRAAIIGTAATYGVVVTPEDIAHEKHTGNANNDWALTRRLLRQRGIDASLDEVIDRFQALYLGVSDADGLRDQETLVAPLALLRRLRQRLPIAIVTGRPRAEAEWFLDRFGVAPLVRLVVGMEDAPAKPAPDPVRLALQQLGVTRAWMVGDTPDDIVAARGAGVVPIGVPAPSDRASAAREALLDAGAAIVIDTLDALEELLP